MTICTNILYPFNPDPTPPMNNKEKALEKINELEKEIVNLKKIVQSANFDKNLPVNFLDACHVTGRDFDWINSLENNKLSDEEVNYIKTKTIFDALNRADGGFIPAWDNMLQDKWTPQNTCRGLVSNNDINRRHPRWFALRSEEMFEHLIENFVTLCYDFLTGIRTRR